jgi:excisionase family DNA binding protein
MTVTQAAAALGVSDDTVLRRIRRGDIEAARDRRGRWRVVVGPPNESPAGNTADAVQPAEPAVQVAVHEDDVAVQLRRDLAHAHELLEAERRQITVLTEQVADYRTQVAARSKAEEELRVLLLRQSEEIERQSEQLGRLLPPPRTVAESDERRPAPTPQPVQPSPAPASPQPLRRRKQGPWWRPWQR